MGKPVTITDAARFAETSDHPLTVMLRLAAEQLERDPPDVFGAKFTLHAARLGQAALVLQGDPAGRAALQEGKSDA